MKLGGKKRSASGSGRFRAGGRLHSNRHLHIILQTTLNLKDPVPIHPDPIYLDHAATTPVRPEVVEAMTACMTEAFGNPSSRHEWGRMARGRLEDARSIVASALDVAPSSVCFTRGGTEADNLAILGLARGVRQTGARPHVVTTAIEHPAVDEAAHQAAREGAAHSVVGFVDGALDLDGLRRLLPHRPTVVSCMWVNNETGLALPIDEIAAVCREWDVPLHSDAVQAVGKIPLPLAETRVDMLTVTGHKICGPKGTGALIVRGGPGRQGISPLHFGGGQEHGLRPGTEDVAGAVGFATALRLAVSEAGAESVRLTEIRDAVESGLRASVPGLRVNGHGLPRAPHILSLAVPGADSDTLLAALDASGIAASGGSACASGSSAPSASLSALYPGDDATSLRLSFGRLNDHGQVDRIVARVAEAVARTRSLVAS